MNLLSDSPALLLSGTYYLGRFERLSGSHAPQFPHPARGPLPVDFPTLMFPPTADHSVPRGGDVLERKQQVNVMSGPLSGGRAAY